MTIEQFRSTPDYVKRMTEIFDDPVMQQAIVLLKDGNPPVDSPVASAEVVSVRILSQMAGYASCLSNLLALATPHVAPVELGQPEWKPEGEE